MKATLRFGDGRPYIDIEPETEFEQATMLWLNRVLAYKPRGEEVCVHSGTTTLNTSTPWGSGRDINRLQVCTIWQRRPTGYEYTAAAWAQKQTEGGAE